MTDTTLPIDPSATAKMDEADQRLLWTGAAANGALVLAMIGFAGNVDDPVAALRMVTIPSLVCIAGFSFGGVAITHGLARLAHRLFEPAAQAKITMAHRMMGSFREVLTTPAMDANVARLVWGDQADDEMRALLLGRLTAAQDATDRSAVVFNEAMETLKASADEGITHLRTAQRWLHASFVAAAFGVVALVSQGWIAPAVPDWAKPAVPAAALPTPAVVPMVTPPAGPVATPTVPAALPACPGDAPDCQPLERAWKEPPLVGKVVPGRAEPVKK